jgi:hypothetical protein
MTPAYHYAYEARSYGLWLGFTGLSFLAWQFAAEGRWRPATLVGLAVAMAASVACHYYAVLVVMALGLGELARSWERRRIDIPVWCALSAAAIPLAFLLPVIRTARIFGVNFWAKPVWMSFVPTYQKLLGDATPLVAALILIGLASVYLGRHIGPFWLLQRHEIVAAAALATLPVVGVLLGRLVTGAYVYRYVLPAIVGFSLLIPFVASRLSVRHAGSAMALAFLGGFTVSSYIHVRASLVIGRVGLSDVQGIPESDLPIATIDTLLYVKSNFYCPAAFNEKLTFLTGLNRWEDLAVVPLKPWVSAAKPLHLEDVDSYISRHKRFLLVGRPWYLLENTGILERLLRSARAEVRLNEVRGEFLTFEVIPRRGSPRDVIHSGDVRQAP